MVFSLLSSQDMRRDLEEPLVSEKDKSGCTVGLSDGTKSLMRLLAVLMLERVAFCCIFTTIYEFTHYYLQFSSTCSTATSLAFSGSAFLLAPLFGVLTDRKTGYIPSLIAAFVFYVTGSGLLLYAAAQTVTNGDKTTDTKLGSVTAVYLAGLIVVTASASAVRAALMPCMVEQLSDGHAKRNIVMAFCSWAFCVINLSAVVAIIPSSLLWKASGFKKSDGVYSSGFFWLYLWPVCFLIICLFILIIWKNAYKSPDPGRALDDVPLPSMCDVIRTAWGCYRDRSRPAYYDPDALPVRNDDDRLQYEKGIERKKLAVLVPVLATMIMYFAGYAQIQSGFKDQGLHLDLSIGTVDETSVNCSTLPGHAWVLISPSVILMFIAVATLFTLAAIPTIIRPCYEKCFVRELTMMTRIQWGMVLSLVGFACATILEAVRLHYKPFRSSCLSIGDKPHLLVYSSLSVFWQVPQYSLLGMSNAFATVAAAEFALSRAPSRFRCTAFGCFWLALGLGHYLGLLIYNVMNIAGLYYRTMERAEEAGHHVDVQAMTGLAEKSRAWVYFLVLTVLVMVNLLAFTWVKYRHQDVQKVERSQAYTIISPM